MSILALKDVRAGYGSAVVLHGISFSVNEGQCMGLLGRNGMGKTTTIRAIMGQLPLMQGAISRFGDERALPVAQIAAKGIGLVPEGRQIFSNLSVRENLTTFWRSPNNDSSSDDSSGARDSMGWLFEDVLALFPPLLPRLDYGGCDLSGGEQQMLAIGRALMTNPRLLILDEATEGLAPIIRKQIWACLGAIRQKGTSILVVDKNIKELAPICDNFHILEKGRTVWEGSSTELTNTPNVQERYLGVKQKI